MGRFHDRRKAPVMYPVEVTYHAARTPQDYRRVHAFLGESSIPLSKPTIFAVRDGEIIGVLGTHKRAKGKPWPFAGPLVAPSAIVTMRLLEAYDRLLGAAGGRHYWFTVQQGTMWYGVVLRFMDQTGEAIIPLGERDGLTWFRRNLVA